jgi:sulfopyruvate decarboxylase subunit alpha
MSASSTPSAEAGPAAATWARAVCRGLAALGCRDVVHVPDNPLSHVLRALADHHPGIRTTTATREEEAFGIAAGLYLGGVRPAVMLQSSGLGNSINALASLHLAFEIPVLLLITMRGGDGEWNPTQQPMGRAVRPILDALGIPHVTIESADRAEAIVRQAGEQAFTARRPGACLLARALWAPAAARP